MKIPSKKIIFGLFCIVFMMIIGVSAQIAKNTSNIEIEENTVAIQKNTMHDEETTEEATDEKEEYLLEEIEGKELLTSVEDDVKTIEGKKDDEPTKSIEVSKSTVDMSPITGEHYTVKNGDTLFFIAQRAKVTISELKAANNLNGDVIHVGQVLQTKRPPKATNVAMNTNQSVSRGTQRDDDIYWLSRIIHAEAQGESYQGKVAVGNVILNRVGNKNFPNSIYGVIFDKQQGYTQFSPVIDGSIYNTPGKESIQAATDVLNGFRPVGEALYFLNPRKATNFWIVHNRKYMKTIGEHDFYY